MRPNYHAPNAISLFLYTVYMKTIKNNWAPEGMIKFCESRLKEIDHVLERIPENALDKTTEKKYHELRIQLENKNHEQKERIKRGETSSIDNMGPSQYTSSQTYITYSYQALLTESCKAVLTTVSVVPVLCTAATSG